MGAATRERPKGLLLLRGRPLIAWQIEAFARAGIEELAIVRGYRGAELRFEATYFDNPRWSDTGIVASLAAAEPWLALGPTVVSYADVVCAPEAVRTVARAEGDIALTYDTNWLELWQRRFADPLSDAETFHADAQGRLREIGRRPSRLEQVRGQYMGLFKLEPSGAARLLERYRALEARDRDRIDMTALFDLALRAGEEIRALPFDGWWCEIDRPQDLQIAEQTLARALPTS